jgi:serine/threonine-protein kinase
LYNVREIIQSCAEGLRHVHERGWIHCDVKPDNFLVDEQANVKLIDFSIARHAKKKSRFWSGFGKSKSIQGTRSYMSPEQIRGRAIDLRSDVYSFGCVCFEVLTNRPPFTGVSPDDVLSKHLKAPLPSLQAFNNRVTNEFAALVAQCLSKNPDGRPQSMKDFLDAYQGMQVFRPGMRPKLD